MKIDLGGGLNCPQGYVGLDKHGGHILVDLEEGALPFLDDSIDEIRAHHILEHISNLIPLMNDCKRVLKQDGLMEIEVPKYPSFTCFVDPTHVRAFADGTFDYFTRRLAYFNYGIKPWTIISQKSSPDYLWVTLKPDDMDVVDG